MFASGFVYFSFSEYWALKYKIQQFTRRNMLTHRQLICKFIQPVNVPIQFNQPVKLARPLRLPPILTYTSSSSACSCALACPFPCLYVCLPPSVIIFLPSPIYFYVSILVHLPVTRACSSFLFLKPFSAQHATEFMRVGNRDLHG